MARHRTAKTRVSHALVSKVSPTHATTRYGFGSTSARRNARGARDAGIGHAAFDREVLCRRKVGEGNVAWSVRDGVTLLGPLRTVYRSRRYGVTLLGPLMAVEWTEGLRRDTQVAVFAQLQVAQLQDACG